MTLKVIETELSVCKVTDYSLVNLEADFVFTGKTDEELSLVCPTRDVPANCTDRDDGWRAFRIEGVLDFSLIGILADITGVLAKARIGLFAVSTYNTDYVLTKKESFKKALSALSDAGYTVIEGQEND